jgi:hypothetical protein
MEGDFDLFLILLILNHPIKAASHVKEFWRLFFLAKGEMKIKLLNNISQIFAKNVHAFYETNGSSIIANEFAHLMITKKELTVTESYSMLVQIGNSSPQFFLMNLPNKEINLLELLRLAYMNSNEMLLIMMIASCFAQNIVKNVDLDKSYLAVLYANRRNFFRLVFVQGENKPGDVKTKRQTITIPNYSVNNIHIVNQIYNFLLTSFQNDENTEKFSSLLSDLIELFDELIEHENDFLILHSIVALAKNSDTRHFQIIKNHRDYFENCKKLTKIQHILDALTMLVDLLDGKSIATFSDQLSETRTKVTGLETSTNEQKVKLTSLEQDLGQVNDRVDLVEQTVDEQEKKIDTIDNKTLLNMPFWCKKIAESLSERNSSENKQAWILVAKRLNFTERDIKGWLAQVDPCMSMLQEWFVVNKSADAIAGLLNVFKELNYADCVSIIENNMTEIDNETKNSLNDDEIDAQILNNPPQVFICFEWSCKSKAQLLKKHLNQRFNDSIRIYFDDGEMGGGDSRNKRIDIGLRSCCVLICLITTEIQNDKTCVSQITQATQLNKSIIPLLLDSKVKWPPPGSLGPILSEYLFIRFFQRPPKELTNDERYWPVDKFNELNMQIMQLVPSVTISEITDDKTVRRSAEVFISYQWDKQRDIIELHKLLTKAGLSVWLDIYEMGGGDSLYDKIDKGLRNCMLVVSCVTTKYGLSANCRKEIALADALQKPIIPVLLERDMKYPPAGPMAPTLSLLKYVDFTRNFDPSDNSIQWSGEAFKELTGRMRENLSKLNIDKVENSKACVIS